MKNSYRLRNRLNGWWAVQIKFWWLPIWLDLPNGGMSVEDAMARAREDAEWRAKRKQFIPTTIELGKLP